MIINNHAIVTLQGPALGGTVWDLTGQNMQGPNPQVVPPKSGPHRSCGPRGIVSGQANVAQHSKRRPSGRASSLTNTQPNGRCQCGAALGWPVPGNLVHPEASQCWVRVRLFSASTSLSGLGKAGGTVVCSMRESIPLGPPGESQGLRGCTGDRGQPGPPSVPRAASPGRARSSRGPWEHGHLLLELGEGLGSGGAHDVMDFGDLVQLVGSWEEGLQTGRT